MKQNLLICVEESDSTIGFYDTSNGDEIARVKVGKWPHEIALTRDGKRLLFPILASKIMMRTSGLPALLFL